MQPRNSSFSVDFISCGSTQWFVGPASSRLRQQVKVREGLETDLARKMVKMIKESKLKVQAAIQGDQLRVSGKKRDDLQQVIQLLRGAKLGIPLQFNNFRD